MALSCTPYRSSGCRPGRALTVLPCLPPPLLLLLRHHHHCCCSAVTTTAATLPLVPLLLLLLQAPWWLSLALSWCLTLSKTWCVWGAPGGVTGWQQRRDLSRLVGSVQQQNSFMRASMALMDAGITECCCCTLLAILKHLKFLVLHSGWALGSLRSKSLSG